MLFWPLFAPVRRERGFCPSPAVRQRGLAAGSSSCIETGRAVVFPRRARFTCLFCFSRRIRQTAIGPESPPGCTAESAEWLFSYAHLISNSNGTGGGPPEGYLRLPSLYQPKGWLSALLSENDVPPTPGRLLKKSPKGLFRQTEQSAPPPEGGGALCYNLGALSRRTHDCGAGGQIRLVSVSRSKRWMDSGRKVKFILVP